MSVDFANAYQEILLDNLVAVIKQNFIFQTQIKLNESVTRDKVQLENELKELKNNIDSYGNISKELENYKQKAEQNSSAHDEKNRIQVALNEEMIKNVELVKKFEEKNKQFEKELNEKNTKIQELQKSIDELKSLVAPTKLKKVSKEKEEKPKVEKFIKPVELKSVTNSGGTF